MATLSRQAPPTFARTAESIAENTSRAIKRTRCVIDEIVAQVKVEDASFANVLLPLAHIRNALISESRVLCFYKHVSPFETLRKASRDAQAAFDQLDREILTREDLFLLVDYVAKRNEKLEPESRRLLDFEHRDFLRNGLKIPLSNGRDHFLTLKARLSEIVDEFRNNLVEDRGQVSFSLGELEGMPVSARDRLKSSTCAGDLLVSFNFPDYYALMRHAKLDETRRKYYIQYLSRCKENVPLFAEAVLIRDQLARMLGYANHAQYRNEELMAQSPDHVQTFLDGLRTQLQPQVRKELEVLCEMKGSYSKMQASPSEVRLFPWDISFYQTMLLQEKHLIDQELIAQYFPLQHVVPEMLSMFQELFGLRFEKAPQAATMDGDNEWTWHPDVDVYYAWNSDAQGGKFLGYLYLDLLVRDAKVGNVSNHNLQPVSQYLGLFIAIAKAS